MKQIQLMVQGAILVTAIGAFSPVTHAQEVAASTGAAPTAALPSAEPDFGRLGQWYLYAPSLQALHTEYTYTFSPTPSANDLYLAAELGTFVRDRLSIGVRLDGSYGWQRQPVSAESTERYDRWISGAQLVVGWQRPLSSWVSFWPKVAAGGGYGRTEERVSTNDPLVESKRSLSRYWVGAAVRLPLVLHLTRHLFMEVAYQLVVDVRHDSRYDSAQLRGDPTFGLGGWF